ncbi:MAG: hypothetical protein ACP5SI_08920 [Chloroflexia bacterium]
MELNTFGAILRFAMDRENQAAAFYEQAARGSRRGIFLEMARGARRRLQRLEQARREGIVEMILEPITGLDSEYYRVEAIPQAGEDDLWQQALLLEEAGERFYRDAAGKMPIREVARIFEQLARESRSRLEELRRAELGSEAS